jgi:tetratricopeptide (TPR) repeat protein
LIELERASSQPKPPKSLAWPLRDLALVHLFGPSSVRDYEQAFVLTREAVEIEPENADNHFRYGIACYRLERYEEAATHLEVSRQLGESKGDNVAAALFYEAMCQAHRKQPLFATQLLEEAKQAYARTDLKYREANSDELSELLWEAERVVRESRIGG